jgi:hypothetical protein
MKKVLILINCMATTAMSACTTEQIYNSGQAWQQNQCGRYQNKADYDRCMSSAAPNYDTYKREVESSK